MDSTKLNLIIGALLHDIGKIIYRSEMNSNHSAAGYEYLKEKTLIKESEILDQVRYHHAKYLRNANISDNSLAYITYVADNIASAADRREAENEEKGYDPKIPLHSVFNILNNNNENKKYKPMLLEEKINYPSDEVLYSREFYSKIADNIYDCLKAYENRPEYINSLLEILEENCSFIPSSTDKSQLADISLYDHVKLTAAVASCIYDYLEGETDYRTRLYKNNIDGEKIFLLYSVDISGIQDFIYTISSKFALKGLRARSFYLELLMEHILDTMLERLELSRANIIYSGGGHAYILLPNTDKCKNTVEENEKEVNKWFLKNFDIALYIAGGFEKASPNDLKNHPKGSYKKIFKNISARISEKKISRYTSREITELNFSKKEAGKRECVICRRSGHLQNNMCEFCSSLINISSDIINKDFFVIKRENSIEKDNVGRESVILPFGCCVSAKTREELISDMKTDLFVRCYCKNKMYSGYNVSTKLWVGDYNKGGDFAALAKVNNGIERICVLRADIDNLGQAFVSGFENERVEDRYVSLSRTAAFSRKLSMFFKYHINEILKNGSCDLLDGIKERNAVIVYSGGDDVFIVGGWSDIIEFAIDLRNTLLKYSQNTLTISAGIGIYPNKYPISAMAEETGMLEDNSKSRTSFNGEPLKNAVTLFEKGLCFGWDELIDNVLNEKFRRIKDFFSYCDERGKSFIYNILNYLRSIENDVINIARYAYMLSRLAPNKNESDVKKERYQYFSKKMYEWMKTEKDRRELITALYLYVYTQRERDDE